MADSPSAGSPTVGAESPAQEKARLRRERRAAKITTGGASRLQAISNLQGGTHRDVEKDVPARPSSSTTTAASASAAAGGPAPDPDEIDISTHHYTPVTQPRLPSPFAYQGDFISPPPSGGQTPDPSQDPMMAMLQKMMGGEAGGMPGMPGAGQPGDLPPGLANIFSAMQGGGAQEPSPDQSSAWIWRLVHSLFSLGLAIYVVFKTPFTGSGLSRTSTSASSTADADWTVDSPAETFKHFFYLFATFEVAMQSSRYFLERGQLQGSGIMSTVAQLVPEPYAGYIRVVGRYSVIYRTVLSDAMVVVFVLGAASWWKGGAAA